MKKLLSLSFLLFAAYAANAALGVNFIAGSDVSLSATNGAGGVDLQINHVSYSNSVRLVAGLAATNYAAIVSNSVRLVAGLDATNYAAVVSNAVWLTSGLSASNYTETVSNSVRLVAGLDATNYTAIVSNSVRLVAGLASTNYAAVVSNSVRLVTGLDATNHAAGVLQSATNFARAINSITPAGGALTNAGDLQSQSYSTAAATNFSVAATGNGTIGGVAITNGVITFSGLSFFSGATSAPSFTAPNGSIYISTLGEMWLMATNWARK